MTTASTTLAQADQALPVDGGTRRRPRRGGPHEGL